MDWLSATSGDTPLDVSKLPGMSPYLALYNAASKDQKGQRFGLGSLQFGAAAANPNLAVQLAAQDKAHRTQEAGGQLENAFSNENAAVTGMAMPLINTDLSRKTAVLGDLGNQASGARSSWANFQVRDGFWSKMLQQAVNGASKGATMAATGGASAAGGA